MTDAPKAGATPANAAATALSPEAQALARVKELRAKVITTQQQIATLEGKLKNRDPQLLERIKKENAELEQRFVLLKKSLFAIITESYQPRSADELKLQYEALRLAAVEYCKKAKIDPELWKSIAS
jgi:hypothetical protein